MDWGLACTSAFIGFILCVLFVEHVEKKEERKKENEARASKYLAECEKELERQREHEARSRAKCEYNGESYEQYAKENYAKCKRCGKHNAYNWGQGLGKPSRGSQAEMDGSTCFHCMRTQFLQELGRV